MFVTVVTVVTIVTNLIVKAICRSCETLWVGSRLLFHVDAFSNHGLAVSVW
jgi:hypothetical protein